jgi:hypothetical protein
MSYNFLVIIFWNVDACGLVIAYILRNGFLYLMVRDGDSKFFQNVGKN